MKTAIKNLTGVLSPLYSIQNKKSVAFYHSGPKEAYSILKGHKYSCYHSPKPTYVLISEIVDSQDSSIVIN